MKSFEDFKINEEWSQQDRDNLTLMCRFIQKSVPSFEVNARALNGSVSIEGKVIFTSTGRETFTVISAFVSGYAFGLAKR